MFNAARFDLALSWCRLRKGLGEENPRRTIGRTSDLAEAPITVSLVKLRSLERHGIDKSSAAAAVPRLPFGDSEDAAAKAAPAQWFWKIEQVEKE